MRKLANISAFESLQPQFGPNAVPDMAVFNMYPEEVLKWITDGNYWWDLGGGIYKAANKFAKEVIDENPNEDANALYERAHKMSEELEQHIRQDAELTKVMETEGSVDDDDNPREEPYEDTYTSYGGVSGVCGLFYQVACDRIDELLKGEEYKEPTAYRPPEGYFPWLR